MATRIKKIIELLEELLDCLSEHIVLFLDIQSYHPILLRFVPPTVGFDSFGYGLDFLIQAKNQSDLNMDH